MVINRKMIIFHRKNVKLFHLAPRKFLCRVGPTCSNSCRLGLLDGGSLFLIFFGIVGMCKFGKVAERIQRRLQWAVELWIRKGVHRRS